MPRLTMTIENKIDNTEVPSSITELPRRSETIITTLVSNYIASGRPVSSKSMTEDGSLNLSAATVRATMARLESLGYIERSHSSAGSVPTDKSFRLYIDTLADLKEPSGNYKKIISSCTADSTPLTPVKTALKITKALSNITHFTGFLMGMVPVRSKIKEIRFMPIDRRNLLVVVVSETSTIKTHLAQMERGLLEGLDIEAASNYLSSIGRGLTLDELRRKIVSEMVKERNLYDKLLSRALTLGEMATREADTPREDQLYFEGEINIFDIEFKEKTSKLRRIFKGLLEEKELLVKILDKAVKNDKVSIHIGSECAPEEFDGLSFVASKYKVDGSPIGTIGIIGPVRMDYSRIIPLVNYSALSLGSAIQ
ncbi:MAG: heat-inducible transcription repressor HrcA [Deltaproteobacteria bacterium]|nr:heat-inducible transcription repressor HrcA [Deltaproteobacteria bacterium]